MPSPRNSTCSIGCYREAAHSPAFSLSFVVFYICAVLTIGSVAYAGVVFEADSGQPYAAQDGVTPIRPAPFDEFLETSKYPTDGITLQGFEEQQRLKARFFQVMSDGTVLLAMVQGTHPAWTISFDTDEDGDFRLESSKQLSPDEEGIFSATFNFGKSPVRFSTGGPFRNELFHHTTIERAGTLEIHGEMVRYVLQGQDGRYDGDSDTIHLDIDQDGVLATFDLVSHERFQVSDKLLNFKGTTYSFSVSSNGDSLRLTESTEHVPPRPMLAIGHTLPGFHTSGIDGEELYPELFRGQLLLLYTWGSWCAPCRPAIADFKDLYSIHHVNGLEMVALNSGDSFQTVVAYRSENSLPWSHVSATSSEAVIELLRMNYTPGSMLIDRESKILAVNLLGQRLRVAIEDYLSRRDDGAPAHTMEDKP